MTIRGQFSRDASDRLTFEIYDSPSERYPRLCKQIARRFNLGPATELVVGLDEMFRDYTDGTCSIGLEWDIWSGFMVVAKQPNSESLVRSIANFLSRTRRHRLRDGLLTLLAVIR